GSARVPQISEQREQPEESTEKIFALGDPGDRFDVQRMQSKKGGDERTAPKIRGHSNKDGKQQQRVGGMQEDICKVMSAGLVAPDRLIQHMREPGDRVPVTALECSESPD